jgi:hypothetical protein
LLQRDLKLKSKGKKKNQFSHSGDGCIIANDW